MEKVLNFLIDNWETGLGISAIVLPILLRLIPTEKNRDVLRYIFEILDRLIPNIKKGGGKHALKMLVFLMLIGGAVSAQNNSVFKGAVSINTDSTAFKTYIANQQTAYGQLGAFYYNESSEKWRIYYDSAWHDMVNQAGDILPAGFSPIGTSLQQVRVNLAGDSLEWFTPLFNPATTNGDLVYFNGTTFSRIGIGTNGYVLSSNGTVPSWSAPTVSGAAGSNTQIQFNNSGAFGADSDLTFSTDRVTATNATVTTDLRLSSLTSGRVPIVTTSGAFTDDANLTYSSAGDSLTVLGSNYFHVAKPFNLVLWSNSEDQWTSLSSAGAAPNLQYSGGFLFTNFNDDDDAPLTIQNTESNINIVAGEGTPSSITIVATGGDLTLQANGTSSDVIIETGSSTGNFKINSGANEQMGSATLSGGTIVVNNTKITANTMIFLTIQVATNPGFLTFSRSPGTGFTIVSSSGTDASVVGWLLIEPN